MASSQHKKRKRLNTDADRSVCAPTPERRTHPLASPSEGMICELEVGLQKHAKDKGVKKLPPHSFATFIAANECKLDVYLRRGKLDEGQYEAGIRYREAFLIHVEGIQTQDSTTPKQPKGPPKTKDELVNTLHWAEKTLREATKRLTQAQSAVVRAVCGLDEWSGNKDRLATLRRALDALARYWKL